MYSNQGYVRSGPPTGGAPSPYRRNKPSDDSSDNVFVVSPAAYSRTPDVVNNLSPRKEPTRPSGGDKWNYLKADMDLSPKTNMSPTKNIGQDSVGGVGSPPLRYGQGLASPGSLERSYDRTGDTSGYGARSPQPRGAPQRHWDQNKNITEAEDPNVSYRARWERNRNLIAQHYREASDSTTGATRPLSPPTGATTRPLSTPISATHRNILDRSFDGVGPQDTPPARPLSQDSGTPGALSRAAQVPHSRSRDPKVSPRDPNVSQISRDPNASHVRDQNVSQFRDPNTSHVSRDSVFGSLKRDPLTHRMIPNGSTRPLRDNLSQSRRSINLSRLSLNRIPKLTLYGKDYGVYNSLVSLALQALISLVFCVMGLQLLLRLGTRSTPGLPGLGSILQSNESYYNVQEVTVAFSSIVVMLNLCCVLTCSMQFFFAAKLIKCPQGEERAFKYLKECTGTRFIAFTGFFLSVIVFFFALMLYMLMEYASTPAIITTVVITIGVSFCFSMGAHSIYFWRVEKAKADQNISPYDPKNPELSTLV